MARRTHPQAHPKHARAHTRSQRQRWATKRLRRAVAADNAYLSGRWQHTVRLEPAQPAQAWRYRNGAVMASALRAHLDSIDAAVAPLRAQLERYGQRGPLYHLPAVLAVTLPRAVRRSLGLYEGFAGVESLHERGDYEPWYYDDWEWRCNRYVRARAQRSWQREIVSDMLSPEHETETERTHPRRCRRRPVTQCGSRRGRAHDWSEYVAREIYWASSQAYEQRSCRRCHAVQKRNLTHEELVRQHAQRDHWSMESILARLYGGRKGE